MSDRGPNPCAQGHLNEDRTQSLRYQGGIWQLFDNRNISCGYVCDRCEGWKKAGYRPEIFTDSQYHADEPIEPEGYYGDEADRW